MISTPPTDTNINWKKEKLYPCLQCNRYRNPHTPHYCVFPQEIAMMTSSTSKSHFSPPEKMNIGSSSFTSHSAFVPSFNSSNSSISPMNYRESERNQKPSSSFGIASILNNLESNSDDSRISPQISPISLPPLQHQLHVTSGLTTSTSSYASRGSPISSNGSVSSPQITGNPSDTCSISENKVFQYTSPPSNESHIHPYQFSQKNNSYNLNSYPKYEISSSNFYYDPAQQQNLQYMRPPTNPPAYKSTEASSTYKSLAPQPIKINPISPCTSNSTTPCSSASYATTPCSLNLYDSVPEQLCEDDVANRYEDYNEVDSNQMKLYPGYSRSSPSGSCTPGSTKSNQKNRGGRWTTEEHERFLEGFKLYGHKWKRVQQVVPTRTVTQVRTHAQKYLLKLQKIQAEQNRLRVDLNHINERLHGNKDIERVIDDDRINMDYHNAAFQSISIHSPNNFTSKSYKRVRVPLPISPNGPVGQLKEENGISEAAETLCLLMQTNKPMNEQETQETGDFNGERKSDTLSTNEDLENEETESEEEDLDDDFEDEESRVKKINPFKKKYLCRRCRVPKKGHQCGVSK